MKILIFLSGSITGGLDSPTAGEGRWGQNLAKMLAGYGHEVDCVGGHLGEPPTWGSTIPVPGVRLYPLPPSDREYDLVLYTPWEHQYNFDTPGWQICTTLRVKAQWFVHCTFSWGKSIADDHTCYNNRHVLAYPYMQENHCFPPYGPENPYRVFFLPLPIYRELAPLNLEGRKDILWTSKDVFHPDWEGGAAHYVPKIGLITLRCIKRLVEEHPEAKAHFLSTRHFHPESSWVARDLSVWQLASSIPGAEFHELVPKDKLVDIMSGTRITTVVSGLLGSFGESIASGAAPLCYSGHIYREAARKHGILLDVREATEDDIWDCMVRLYEDDQFYRAVIGDYREELRHYSYAVSYEHFKNMCNELGLHVS